MKKIFLYIAGIVLLASCDKKEVGKLNFDVKTDKQEYKLGDSVKFILSGNPDQVVFYSGENGHKYDYKSRTEAESNEITLEFATNRRYGSDVDQPQSFRVFASQKFNGIYSEENVKEASEWTEITSAFTLSAIMGNDNYTPSGAKNLLDLSSLGLNIDKTKPIYFAFKYKGTTGTTQPRWWVNKFDVKMKTSDGEVLTVTTIGDAGWKNVKFGNSPVLWTFNSDNTVKFQGGGAAVGSNEVWAVTKAIKLTSVTPDAGKPLKNMTTKLDGYSYYFSKPGTYKVTFDAFNVNIYGESRTVKSIEVKINP